MGKTDKNQFDRNESGEPDPKLRDAGPSGSDYMDSEDSPTLTKFGMLPPRVSSGPQNPKQTSPTGSFSGGFTVGDSPTSTSRFGIIPPNVAFGTTANLKPPEIIADEDKEAHAQSSKLSAQGESLLLFWSSFYPILLLGLFIVTLLGVGIYVFSYYYSQGYFYALSNRSSRNMENGTQIRFFGMPVFGNRFLFVIDRSVRMGEGDRQSSFQLASEELQQSLNMLTETDSFEVVFFNRELASAFSSGNKIVLSKADAKNLAHAKEWIARINIEGANADPHKALLTAVQSEADVLLFVCETLDASSISVNQLSELAALSQKMNVLVVECGLGRKPFQKTSLELFVQKNRGGYLWKNMAPPSPEAPVHRTETASLFAPEENEFALSDSDFLEMISSDFNEPKFKKQQNRKIADNPFLRSSLPDPLESEPSSVPPKKIDLPNPLIAEIEADARTVYLSGLEGSSRDPKLLTLGAEQHLKRWVQGAKAGLPGAEYLLGLCYRNGVGVLLNSTKAFQCLTKSAEGGCVPAMSLLGDFYMFGSREIRIDTIKSQYWYEKAALIGEPTAQTWMGYRFAISSLEKIDWYTKAAALNFADAQFLLGQCFESGDGIPKNLDKAVFWYQKAAEKNHRGALGALKRLGEGAGGGTPTPLDKETETTPPLE